MQYRIIVDKQSRNNPSAEKREYVIDIEELRCKGDVYDSLVITKDEDYVMRRLSLSEYNVLSVLDEPIKEPLNSLNIELFEGDNYIYLVDMVGNYLYATYIVKNEFTDMYVTQSDMNSAITSTANSIELSVNQKLTGYSTTEEMNALIQAIADNILLEVSKKVGDDEIISKINMSPEEIQIAANKIVLTAVDILKIIANSEINLTSNNIAIESDNFSVDKDGNMDCKNGSINTGKDITVGDNLYIGQNQNSNADLIKYLYFSKNAYIKRWIFGSGKNYLKMFSDLNTQISCNDTGYVNVMENMITMSHTPDINSDKRLKKNIKDIDVSWIDDIKVKEFEYKNTPDKKQIGVIAQDYLDKDYSKYFLCKNQDNFYTVNYMNITNALIKYCQELKQEINKLKEGESNG